jgi:triosephosphate isomerase (TIM)
MRKVVIAGNWKMYKDLTETTELVNALKTPLKSVPPSVIAVICPPFTSLSTAGGLIKDTRIRLGAQNMSEHDEGAHTGEISWKMLKSVGCEYVIVGHSERRQFFGETNELINRKARKALANRLRPIICVGETLQERESGVTGKVVGEQVRGVLQGITAPDMENVIIAYEPVWAIGTGKTATPAQAEEVHLLIRNIVSGMLGKSVAENLVIQYGGSVKPDNAADLLSQNDIDGALVGGACLKADSFSAIFSSVKR